MDTKILQPTTASIKYCASLIKLGELVAFPTETVYGLGANALNEKAVRKIYDAKGRPSDNPLIVHVDCRENILKIVKSIPPIADKLIEKFMPGALTLVFEKKSIVPMRVTGGLETVAVRMPNHKAALDLIKESGLPICAPSANTSGKPSPTLARHVMQDLSGKIPAILDGGACRIGVESTVLDLTTSTPRLLREGGISIEQLEAVIGHIEIVKDSSKALCPGMKYKHYSPKAEVFFSAFYSKMQESISIKYDGLIAMGRNPVIMCLDERAEFYGGRNVFKMGASYEDYAHNLFKDLREADEKGYDAVIAEGVPNEGIGEALINRLVKSSGGQII